MIVGRQLRPKIVGVADVKEPPAVISHGDAAVPHGMAEEGHEEHLELAHVQQRPRLGPVPPAGGPLMRLPSRPVVELGSGVPLVAGPQAIVFLGRHVHRGGGKISQPAGVIRIPVREDDVRHVRGLEAESFNLSNSGQRLVELEPGRIDGGLAYPFERPSDVLEADSRVDQNEAAFAFEQQAVASGRRIGRRVQDTAV